MDPPASDLRFRSDPMPLTERRTQRVPTPPCPPLCCQLKVSASPPRIPFPLPAGSKGITHETLPAKSCATKPPVSLDSSGQQGEPAPYWMTAGKGELPLWNPLPCNLAVSAVYGQAFSLNYFVIPGRFIPLNDTPPSPSLLRCRSSRYSPVCRKSRVHQRGRDPGVGVGKNSRQLSLWS